MKVLVTGGTGFVGRHLIPRLQSEGFDVRSLARRPGDMPAGVESVAGSITDRDDVRRAVEGVDAVVHLVAIIVERGTQTFEAVNHGGTRTLVEAMQAEGVRRLVHQSALGAGPDERYPYLRTKWLGEEAIRASSLDWTILRPSVVHGPGAGFFRPIMWSLRWAPVYPMPAGGRTRFQPIAIDDLATCFVRALRGEQVGATLDLGGPEIMTFSDIVRTVMEVLGKRRKLVSVPVWAARPFAAVQGLRKEPLVTNQQLDMVVLDNTCALDSVERTFGFRPVRMADTDLRWLARL
ncbi:MAG TPA: complex I NDUFA9 subunit family protein [Actinomycetota bacterium]|nr:complex I NDUFA9 subunit family protein [Actinomycetota bacterium]